MKQSVRAVFAVTLAFLLSGILFPASALVQPEAEKNAVLAACAEAASVLYC